MHWFHITVASIYMVASQKVPIAGQRPHIVVLLADDLGWADVSLHNQNGERNTTNIDKLASEGLELRRHYAFKVCSPSRQSFLTGRYPYHVGNMSTAKFFRKIGNPNRRYGGVPPNMTMISEKLKEVGYRNHFVGKWDVGFLTARHMPRARGFDSFLGYLWHAVDYWTYSPFGFGCGKHDHDMLDLWENDQPAFARAKTGYLEEMLLNRTIDIIRNHPSDGNPLFLVHAFHLVHTPLQVPRACERENVPSFRRKYVAMIEYLDNEVGQIATALQETELWKDTFLLFTSDNGGQMQPASVGNNYPLRGGKTTYWEGGIRVFTFLSGGFLHRVGSPETKSNALFHVSDWYTTFAALAGVDATDIIAERFGLDSVDGVNQWSVIAGESNSVREEIYISDVCLIRGHWKFLLCPSSRLCGKQTNGASLFPVQSCNEHSHPCNYSTVHICRGGCLFDVFSDPHENYDVAHVYVSRREEMAARLRQLNAESSYLQFLQNSTLDLRHREADELCDRDYVGPV